MRSPSPGRRCFDDAPPSFHRLVDDYLRVRRGLGFDLESTEWKLRNFANYADRIGHNGAVTIELAVEWAQSSRSSNPAQAVRRLAAVRQFARHRALFDPATEVPPVGLLGRIPRRPPPHIYTEAEVAALLQQASRLRPEHGLRPATYVAYFSLLVSTGLRLSEACRLTTNDVDLVNGILVIRETKFRKSRLVPLHPSTTQALARYATAATHVALHPGRSTSSAPSIRPDSSAMPWRRRSPGSGSVWAGPGTGARANRAFTDLRHTFVTRRLLRWCQDGADVDRILALATYLGHAKVTDTYWYCTAVPELLGSTSQRFERFAHPALERPS